MGNTVSFHKRRIPSIARASALLFGIALFTFAPIALAQTAPQALMGTSATGIPHALLYITNSAAGIASLRAHIDSMDIIAPQTYAATALGKLLGKPNAEILKLARDAGARVMPLVVNQNFSQKGIHDLLEDDAAQNTLIAALINEAKLRGYIGYQYDFEHMQASDRDLYSVFVAKSVPYFHNAGLQLSVAVAPLHSDLAIDYGAGSWQNWTGAFDYRALGKSADFVSVMAYDDSKSVGPVASIPWVEDVVSYTLARIPASKVSLGIPFYAWVWSAKTNTRTDIRGYPSVGALLQSKTYLKKGFSDTLGVPYVTYYKGGQKYTAWYEDQQSFQKKLSLVTDNHLAGFSAWAVGLEDPKVWDVMLAMRAPQYGLALAPGQ